MSEHSIETHIPRWTNDQLSLVCGIANAGGGLIFIDATERDYSSGFRRHKKPFEAIPRLSQQFLGIACTTEPIMYEGSLALQVNVPSADEPIAYKGVYWLFADGVNEAVTKQAVEDARARADEEEGAGENERVDVDQLEDLIPLGRHDADGSAPGGTAAGGLSGEAAAGGVAPGGVAKQLLIELKEMRSLDPDEQEEGRAVYVELMALLAEALGAAQSTSFEGTSQVDRLADSTQVNNADDKHKVAHIELTSTDEFVRRALSTNGRVTAPRIAEVLGVSESTVRRSFRKLRDYGLIERVGSKKAGYWALLDQQP